MKNEIVEIKIPVQEKKYEIMIGENLIKNAGNLIKEKTNAKKVLFVTNTTVYPLFEDRLKTSLNEAGISFEFVVLEDGEKYKNIESLEQIWQKAIEYRLERKDAIIALGGGVIGDITGFAASAYLRGVNFIQIPTTLLAQVDSSVGGKTAINHQLGKNLIGAFYQPCLVLSDLSTLTTLSVDELKTGLAEVVKYAFIEKSCGLNEKELNFIEFLEVNKEKIFELDSTIMQKLIVYCCKLKASVVNQDEKEVGLRAILNFGHTIGHGIEKCSNYQNINHGRAVAIGMRGVFKIALEIGMIEKGYYEKAIGLLEDFGLNYRIPSSIDKAAVLDAMSIDKKVKDGKIRIVMPVSKGEVCIKDDISYKIILEAIGSLY